MQIVKNTTILYEPKQMGNVLITKKAVNECSFTAFCW